MDTLDAPKASFAQSWPGRFLLAPLSGRTYLNLIYLALAFPLGLVYFLFLAVGLSVGLGLTIVWVGIPILALVLAGSWGAAALERQMAIHLLGAQVAPMAPTTAPAEAGVWARLRAVLANPVTWKGMGFMAIKFPLGIFTFVLLVTLVSLSGALILAPFFYAWSPPQIFLWEVDTLDQALVCSLIGVATLLVSLNAFNLLAKVWGWLSRVALGSERFSAVSQGPASPAAAPPAALAMA